MAIKILQKKKKADATAPADDENKNKPGEEQAEGAETVPGEQDPEKKTPSDEDGDETEAAQGAGIDIKVRMHVDTGGTMVMARDAAEISDLCVLYGEPNLISGFITKGFSAETVRKELLSRRNEAEKVKAAAGVAVQTAHAGATRDPSNALVEDMKRRFPAAK